MVWSTGSLMTSALFGLSYSTNTGPAEHQTGEHTRRRAIVGGRAVSGTKYPWMGSIRYEIAGKEFQGTSMPAFYRFCGGSLIDTNPIAIVTAAHCLEQLRGTNKGIQNNVGEDIRLYVDLGRTLGPNYGNLPGSEYTLHDGTTGRDDNGDWVSIAVSSCDEIYVHRNWTGKVGDGNDIALIIVRVESEIQKLAHYDDSMVATVTEQLSKSEVCCEDEEELMVLGYGTDDDNSAPTDTLEHIELEFHPPSECERMLRDFYGFGTNNPSSSKEVICASGDGVEVDACTGDSGGPLFRYPNGTGHSPELCGLVSFGLAGYYDGDQCNPDHPHDKVLPAFYSSVGHYHDWIMDTISSSQNNGQCLVKGAVSTVWSLFRNAIADNAWVTVVAVGICLIFTSFSHCFVRWRWKVKAQRRERSRESQILMIAQLLELGYSQLQINSVRNSFDKAQGNLSSIIDTIEEQDRKSDAAIAEIVGMEKNIVDRPQFDIAMKSSMDRVDSLV